MKAKWKLVQYSKSTISITGDGRHYEGLSSRGKIVAYGKTPEGFLEKIFTEGTDLYVYMIEEHGKHGGPVIKRQIGTFDDRAEFDRKATAFLNASKTFCLTIKDIL